MKKYDLLRSGDNFIRVLEIRKDRILIIDCIKRTMPVWIMPVMLASYAECTINDLSVATAVRMVGIDTLDADQRKVMYERYTMIAPILASIADNKKRSQLIQSIAMEHGISRQTVRNYLCLYLSYLDIAVLAPIKRQDNRELTQDEMKCYNKVVTGVANEV